MPTGAVIASFVRFYPGEFREGRISWPWFRFLKKWQGNARALEVINAARAVETGAMGLLDGEVAKRKREELLTEIETEQ